MSSILRALRRLDDDNRPSDDDVTLREHVVIPETRPGRASRSPVYAIAALAAVVVLGAMFVRALLPTRMPEPAAPVRSALEEIGLPARGVVANGVTRAPIVAPGTSRFRDPPRQRRPPVATPGPTSERRTPVALIKAPPRVAKPATRKVPSSPATRDLVANAPTEAPTTTARVSPSRDPSPGPPALTPVGVERILWHPNADRRRAWLRIDGAKKPREVRLGETVGNYSVDQIDAGSVLFRSGKTEIRYKLGAPR